MINIKSFSHTFKHSGWKTLLLVMALNLLMYTIVLAASGGLDTTFSGDGKLTTDIAGWDDRAYAVTIQSDGKIVAVGSHSSTLESDFVVARYNLNGSLDTSFSGNGIRTTDFGKEDEAKDVAIQSNGKIVVTGNTCEPGGDCDLVVARYNPNGDLDTTFSGDGKVIVNFGGKDNGTNGSDGGGLVIQPDGRIVVAGFLDNGSDYDFAVYRLNSNGSLDTTFSSDGKQKIGFGSGRDDTGSDLAIHSGKIVVAGDTCDAGFGSCNFALARLNSNGTLDTTFGGDGRTVTDFGGDEEGNAVAIQQDGKIVVAGASEDASSEDFALARYNLNGSLDTSFSLDGKHTTHFPGYASQACGVVIQPDGKIVAVGFIEIGETDDFALVRYKTNGWLDKTFSGDGKVTTDFGIDSMAMAVALQSNGRIIAAGWANDGIDRDIALARYLP